jgi:hypothetical protein
VIFSKLLCSTFSFVSLDALTALEYFSSTAPGNHVQWILVECIPPGKQNHFRRRLKSELHYFMEEKHKRLKGKVSFNIIIFFNLYCPELLSAVKTFLFS